MDASNAILREPVAFGERLAAAAADLLTQAKDFDHHGADPRGMCSPLSRFGMFYDALPRRYGGSALCEDSQSLHGALVAIGGANLSAGRIFEGHVNAVKLVCTYGSADQVAALARDVQAGAICGVWNAEGADGLKLDPGESGGGMLAGGKIFASGIDCVTRPLATSRLPDGGVQLVLTGAPSASDFTGWTARGMRATATGVVDFTGVEVGPEALIGAPGDYYRSPLFKGGAWRFAAAQVGAVLQIQALLDQGLKARGRDADPLQRARTGAVALAAHTAHMWTMQAAAMEADPNIDPSQIDAFASLARLAVEKAALEVIALAERSLGLSAFLRPDPLDRIIRDLSTYLRQPFPDAVLDEAAAYVSDHGGRPPWSAAAEPTQ